MWRQARSRGEEEEEEEVVVQWECVGFYLAVGTVVLALQSHAVRRVL